jgi:uncharacterized ferritin-like protein (DUF455 family)
MWDMICRFVTLALPMTFYDDWVRIAREEAEHFTSWATRLTELGSFYGDLPGHDGLWDSAQDTAESALARLAVVHLVHEARGLDVYTNAVQRFERADDTVSLAIINKNYRDAAGVKWFRFLCARDDRDPITTFHETVRRYFQGALKPPFNKEARDAAGLMDEWYLPLTTESAQLLESESA